MRHPIALSLAALALAAFARAAETTSTAPAAACPLVYINTAFENASPVWWEINEQGEVHLFLVYDHERSSLNRAAGHWHFRVEAPKGSELTLIFNNFDNIYNGRKGPLTKEGSMSFSDTASTCCRWPTRTASPEAGRDSTSWART